MKSAVIPGLANLLTRRRLTYQQAANKLGIHKSIVGLWANGKRGVPANRVAPLAVILGMSVEKLTAPPPPSKPKRCRLCNQVRRFDEFRPTAGRLCRLCKRAAEAQRARQRATVAAAQEASAQASAQEAAQADLAAFWPTEDSPAQVLTESVPVRSRGCHTPGCTRRPANEADDNHGNRWCLECQLAGHAGYVRPISDLDRPGCYVFRVGFSCMLCGRPIATVKVARPAAVIQLPPYLRCKTCGGAPIRNGDVVREFSSREPFDDDDRPRVGRPTREMVAARAEAVS